MAAGRPVIAYSAGGALETVIEGITGVFFDEQTPESLIEGIKRLEMLMPFDKDTIRRHALQFDRSVFMKRFQAYIEACLADQNRNVTTDTDLRVFVAW
jgi:glycosyltransferase involved in cell wall biosynthesis